MDAPFKERIPSSPRPGDPGPRTPETPVPPCQPGSSLPPAGTWRAARGRRAVSGDGGGQATPTGRDVSGGVPAGKAEGRTPHGRAASWRPRPAQRQGSRGQVTSGLPEPCDVSAARGSGSVPCRGGSRALPPPCLPGVSSHLTTDSKPSSAEAEWQRVCSVCMREYVCTLCSVCTCVHV